MPGKNCPSTSTIRPTEGDRQEHEGHGGKGGPEREQRTRTEADDQVPGPATEHRRERDQGQERGACLGGRVALHLDEIEGHEEEGRSERGVEERGGDVGSGEDARSKELERHHRFLHAGFDDDEESEQRRASEERSERARGAEAAGARCFEQRPYDRAQPDDGEQRPRDVELRRRAVVTRFRDVPGREQYDHRAEGRVEEEQPSPRRVRHDPAAEDRPDGGR